MGVDNLHEEFDVRQGDWQMIRDSIQGERVVKAKGVTYLPAPPGMDSNTSDVLHSGKRYPTSRYDFYLSFAEFPELISSTLNGFQGTMHTNEPHVELPSKMEYLLEDATPEGEPLQVLWERVTRELLTTGRVGLLADPWEEDDTLRLATYSAENIINWRLMPKRDGGKAWLAVLREYVQKPKEDDPFEVEEKVNYWELRLDENGYWVRVHEADSDRLNMSLAGYKPASQSNQTTEIVQDWFQPALFGKALGEIPLTVFNVHEQGFDFGPMPILPLVRRAMSIYRKSADYNRALYIKGDPQVVLSGVTQQQAPTQIGGDSIWCLPNPQAKANYLDIDGQGIPLMKDAINDEYERFYQEGGKLLDTAERSAESGEALRRRQNANQVSLHSIAQNAGFIMQEKLRSVARNMGEDPEAVKFEANTDFSEPVMEGRELLDIMAAKAQGAPLTQKSIHAKMRRGGLTDMTFSEEDEILKKEAPLVDGMEDEEPGDAEKATQNTSQENDDEEDSSG